MTPSSAKKIPDVTFKTCEDLRGEIAALLKGDIDGLVQDLSIMSDVELQLWPAKWAALL